MRGLTILFGRASGAGTRACRVETHLAAGFAIVLLLLAPASAAVVDRIAVAVDNRAIKESQIDRDLRLTAFLNGTPLDEGTLSKRKAADRLIDQTVIRSEITKGTYPQPSDAEVNSTLAKIKQARF